MNISVAGVVLPNVPLSNFQLIEAAKKLGIKNFRGVVCRDELPIKPKANECGIVNLDDGDSRGSHWVAYFKKGNIKIYCDSYGLHPPDEIIKYLGKVYYNTERIQPDGTVFCGHLSLYVVKKLRTAANLTQAFQELINNLY